MFPAIVPGLTRTSVSRAAKTFPNREDTRPRDRLRGRGSAAHRARCTAEAGIPTSGDLCRTIAAPYAVEALQPTRRIRHCHPRMPAAVSPNVVRCFRSSRVDTSCGSTRSSSANRDSKTANASSSPPGAKCPTRDSCPTAIDCRRTTSPDPSLLPNRKRSIRHAIREFEQSPGRGGVKNESRPAAKWGPRTPPRRATCGPRRQSGNGVGSGFSRGSRLRRSSGTSSGGTGLEKRYPCA